MSLTKVGEFQRLRNFGRIKNNRCLTTVFDPTFLWLNKNSSSSLPLGLPDHIGSWKKLSLSANVSHLVEKPVKSPTKCKPLPSYTGYLRVNHDWYGPDCYRSQRRLESECRTHNFVSKSNLCDP
ncbi:hypothetical protein CSKR_109595 [Clonorchis sinensis]|uniref:Uncharacterized protein n=1 Tax=Clonorchis sinensis TaxID=79923 RepID=A0A3R7DIW1_CLOSI|nr:hypothetical protein CSKR_109595 [Clonorchis sinensis]